MIRATPPRGKPVREWVCVYCPAHGPADTEEHMRQLTQEHLETCEARLEHDAKIARAMAALES